MCVVSMVHDHYEPLFPDPSGSGGLGGLNDWLQAKKAQQNEIVDLAELRKLIAEFREAIEAAKKVDVLTKQPDCLDPEKAKLQERVDRLEKIIDALLHRPG